MTLREQLVRMGAAMAEGRMTGDLVLLHPRLVMALAKELGDAIVYEHGDPFRTLPATRLGGMAIALHLPCGVTRVAANPIPKHIGDAWVWSDMDPGWTRFTIEPTAEIGAAMEHEP